MTRTRKASVILSIPAILMSSCWLAAYCFPRFGLTEPSSSYLIALEYLSWVSFGLAVILLVRAQRSRDVILCFVINLIAATLNIFGPLLCMSRALPYIKF